MINASEILEEKMLAMPVQARGPGSDLRTAGEGARREPISKTLSPDTHPHTCAMMPVSATEPEDSGKSWRVIDSLSLPDYLLHWMHL